MRRRRFVIGWCSFGARCCPIRAGLFCARMLMRLVEMCRMSRRWTKDLWRNLWLMELGSRALTTLVLVVAFQVNTVAAVVKEGRSYPA